MTWHSCEITVMPITSSAFTRFTSNLQQWLPMMWKCVSVYLVFHESPRYLIQVMACCLFGIKLIPVSVLIYWQQNHEEHVSVKSSSKCNNALCLQNCAGFTGVKQCIFHWLIYSELVNKDFNSLIIHQLIMITCITCGNLFAILNHNVLILPCSKPE